MLNWGREIPEGHPLRRNFPQSYPAQVLPEAHRAGHLAMSLYRFHDSIFDLQRRFLRVIAEGIGCHETFFDEMLVDGPTLTRSIRYPAMTEAPEGGHVWAGEHGDINLITALPTVDRAGAAGARRTAGGSTPSRRPGQVIVNTGMMLERLTNGVIPTGQHRVVAAPGYDGRAVQRRAVLPPDTVDAPAAGRRRAARPSTRSASAAVTAADALTKVLYEINLVEDARRVT